jgi:hypothetical protein
MIKQFSAENGPVGVLKPSCITQGAHIPALTARHQIKLTSPRCPSAWQPNPGRGSTYRRGKIVQTNETSSLVDDALYGVGMLRDNLDEKGGGDRILKRRPVAGL